MLFLALRVLHARNSMKIAVYFTIFFFFSFLISSIFSVTSANGLRTCPSIFLPRLLLDPVSPWFIINLLIWFVSAVSHYTAHQVLFNFSPFYRFRVLTSLVFTSLKIIKIQWTIANATAVPKSYQRHFSLFFSPLLVFLLSRFFPSARYSAPFCGRLSPGAPITAHIKFVHKNFIYALENLTNSCASNRGPCLSLSFVPFRVGYPRPLSGTFTSPVSTCSPCIPHRIPIWFRYLNFNQVCFIFRHISISLLCLSWGNQKKIPFIIDNRLK